MMVQIKLIIVFKQKLSLLFVTLTPELPRKGLSIKILHRVIERHRKIKLKSVKILLLC